MTLFRVFFDDALGGGHIDIEAPDPWEAKREAMLRIGEPHMHEGPLVIATRLDGLRRGRRRAK